MLAPSYDIAAAIELFGPAHGLRSVISPHNSYFVWGTELLAREPSDIVIAIGIPEARLTKHFRHVQRAAHQRCDICLEGAPDLSVFVAREPVTTVSDLFVALRRIK